MQRIEQVEFKKIIVLDTETTSLTGEIAQLAFVIYNMETNQIEYTFNQLIQLPEESIMTEEAFGIHKISKEMCQTRGIHALDMLKELKKWFAECSHFIAHNFIFDRDAIVRCMIYYRFPMDIPPFGCTMKYGKDLGGFYNKLGKLKSPNLGELHQRLFNEIPKNTHDAMIDVLATLHCLVKMKNNTDLRKTNRDFRHLYRLYCITKDKDIGIMKTFGLLLDEKCGKILSSFTQMITTC